jgi:hypothetical protein
VSQAGQLPVVTLAIAYATYRTGKVPLFEGHPEVSHFILHDNNGISSIVLLFTPVLLRTFT